MNFCRWTVCVLFACVAGAPAAAQSDIRIYNLLHAERTRLEAIEEDPAAPAELKEAAKARRERLAIVMYEPELFRVQVALTEIVAVEGEAPTLKTTHWRSGMDYFYPASAIKLCGAVAALERLNEVRHQSAPDLSKFSETTPLAFHPLKQGSALLETDPDNLDGQKLTLAHLIREACLVSDNEAYNRLYDFCGQKWLNERMWRAGLTSTRLTHRLSVDLPPAKQKVSPAIEVRLPDGPVTLGAQYCELDLKPDPYKQASMFVGRGFMEGSERVRGPFSFVYKNVITLADLQKCLVRVTRPDIPLPGEPFDLSDAQRAFLMEALSQYPGDSPNPVYPREKFPDEYAKYFLPGLARVVPKEHLKVYDKVGQAYGFVIDNAYVVDTRTNRGFFLAATLWADSDGTLNDDKYDYENLAVPFLADVAEIIARDVWGVPVAK